MIQVLADESMPGVVDCLRHLPAVRLRRFSGRRLQAADLVDVDWLLVRSITPVNAATLGSARPRFVGTATIGTDHLDIDWLQQTGIAWSAAPGCNARAVAEWVATALALLARDTGMDLGERHLGVVGCGQVGRQVARLARALGLRVSLCDPFLDTDPTGLGLPLLSLESLLAQVDVVSLHTPLTRDGAHPTQGMIDAGALARLRPGSWLLNAGRGEVIVAADLLAQLQAGRDLQVVLDVWPQEPALPPALLAQVRWGSPHVAGHSLEGKWRGSWQIIAAACAAEHLPAPPPLLALLPAIGQQRLPWPAAGRPLAERLAELLTACVDLPGDDRRLRAAVAVDGSGAGFDALRRDYAVRREFMAHDLLASSSGPAAEDAGLRRILGELGFRC